MTIRAYNASADDFDEGLVVDYCPHCDVPDTYFWFMSAGLEDVIHQCEACGSTSRLTTLGGVGYKTLNEFFNEDE